MSWWWGGSNKSASAKPPTPAKTASTTVQGRVSATEHWRLLLDRGLWLCGEKYKHCYVEGARVWVKDPETVWKSANVTRDFDGKRLCLEVGEEELEPAEIEVKSDEDLPPLRNPDILIGENDLTNLSYLHEPAVLHNLAVRFLENRSIYTYCGIVLVAINPYEELHIYGNDTIGMYRGKNMGDLDPHIYAVSEEAFTKMERDDMNQSIIVSGESGAGKTVSAKFAMRYFATVGGTSQTETQVEKKVLASSPIMEAIGNAKTTRNDNSSRFGKYIEIDFNKHFHIIGANMRTYLLEKSRVVFQAPDERNYHVFYQMCAAREEDFLSSMRLDEPDAFRYLNQGENPEIDGVDDLKEFNDTLDAFRLLGFAEKDLESAFRILSGILHLGNVEIEPGGGRGDSESSAVAPKDGSLKTMAALLEIEEEQIRKWLCNRKIVTARESYTKPMNAEAAQFARDALAKCIYSNLFDWIVIQINKSLRTSAKTHKFIGVLDIYGFETFEVNSFEQFCINYANEKLQQQFNLHVFKLEQEEYLKEGIDWKMIDFYDNQPCIDLIESKLGILDLLDEECRVPKGSDQGWVEKLYDKCKKWEHFSKPRLSQTAFVVRHFADMVEYESAGFLDKNRDTVLEEQINILKASNNDLLSDLFMENGVLAKEAAGAAKKAGAAAKPSAGGAGGANKKQHKKTVGSQFADSLKLLMSTLNSTTPHYVRCIKPNDDKAAFQFDPRRGVQQLRACGVLETVRISAAGYPSRWTYYDFFLRYRVLCHSRDVRRDDYRATCEGIVANMIDDEDKYRFGKTKLFFRAGQVAYMEKLRSERLRDCGIMIQKHVKGWLYRKRYRQVQAANLTIQRYVRGFLGRRRVKRMRRNAAAITIQRYVRGWVKRTQYLRLKERTVRLQARCRGVLSRRRHKDVVYHTKATIIQRNVRMWLAKRRYQRAMRQVVLVQSLVRRRLAKKQFKRLKAEAKSVEHQKKLNQGLENKIISLQQKLTASEKLNKEVRQLTESRQEMVKEMDALKKSEQQAKAAVKAAATLEEEVALLRKELERERAEKVDLVNEREAAEAAWKEKEGELEGKVISLAEELETAREQSKEKGQVTSDEFRRRLEEEREALHSEYEQERIAYQKLLKDYNRLETQHENLQDEYYASKGIERTQSSMSFASSSFVGGEDLGSESAYGSQLTAGSGKSSISRAHGGGTGDRPRLDQVEWGGDGDSAAATENVGLTVKLQQKLKEAQRDKEKLEKRLEELEKSDGEEGEEGKKAAASESAIRLSEVEAENARLMQNLQKMREAVVAEQEDGEENAQFREMIDQFEQLQDELERRREECIQLRTVLASQDQPIPPLSRGPTSELPEAEELFTAYETQKSVIATLQDQLQEERARAKETETDMRSELDKLGKTCSEQQAVINGVINKANPANQVEACLQHEISRLTGENFDLREKIEALQETVKRLKRQLRSYMKRLNEVGAALPPGDAAGDPDLAEVEAAAKLNGPEQLPMVRKKEHDFLGMFEYRKESEQQVLKALIYDLKPKMAVQMLPGLPAYVLFMMIRHTDYVNNDENVRSLIQGAISLVKKVVKKRGMNDLEVKTLWLSNMLRILHNLKQYSGEKQFQQESSAKQIEQCLRNFDLSEYRRVLSDIAIWIYQGMTKLIEEEIQPILVPAVLEHEGIGGISGDKPRPPPRPRQPSGSAQGGTDMDTPTHIDPYEALDRLLRLLTRFHATLTKHGLDPEIIAQIFKQVFYFVCAGALNNLLLRKDMCHWSRGMQIRYNVAQLEQWARDQKVHDDQTRVIDALAPIVQASQLLQARKSDEDVQAICDMCSALKVSQIIKILNLYTPLDEFEERVSPSFVRKIQAKLQDRANAESEQQVTLLMDTKFSFAVRFPFNPSTIQLEELEIPEYYNNLHKLLKKV